jgi:hypothetical protein
MERMDSIDDYADLKEASVRLRKRAKAPRGLDLEVGEYNGKFYQIDWFRNKISRLTLGAFEHLHRVWTVETAVFANL